MHSRTFTAATVFFSSFLLFTLEPMVGKRLLPWFGGASNVWVTLIMLYMVMLLLGYMYTMIIKRFSHQKHIHLTLIVCTFIFLIIQSPLLPTRLNVFSTNPIISVLYLALIHIGLPFFLLSTTSTLLQYWFGTYSLFAWSNAGSLAGLLAYPFLIEPHLPITTQGYIWTALCVVILIALTSITLTKKHPAQTALYQTRHIHWNMFFLWTGLSAVTTLSLVSTTTVITQKLMPAPLLWIIPLGIYLLSFVIVFNKMKRWNDPIMLLATIGTIFISATSLFFGIIGTLLSMTFIMFTIHRYLYEMRPDSTDSPEFYVAIALGSTIASLFCTFIAVSVFPDYWEYPLGLILAGISCVIILYKKRQGAGLISIATITTIAILYFCIPSMNVAGSESELGTISQKRNFYSVTKVINEKRGDLVRRVIYDGTIFHGAELLFPDGTPLQSPHIPPQTGIGPLFTKHPQNIGIIGLGPGILAEFCAAGDTFRFYELNPEVIRAAERYFSTIARCKQIGARLDIVPGDGRLSLEKEPETKRFDLLILDAFTNGNIPTHLLTRETFTIYKLHLTEHGIFIVHASRNAHVMIQPVIEAHAHASHMMVTVVHEGAYDWFLLSQDTLPIGTTVAPRPDLKEWTDEKSSVLDIIKF